MTGMPLAASDAYGAVLGDTEFEFIRHVIAENAGIVLGPNKRQLVQGRLVRRLRELALPTFEAYCEHVRNSGPEELVGLINAITTNVTAFFRENHHFEALAGHMLAEAQTRNAQSRRVRIWSAGCSTGEEPYSIAMTLHRAMASVGRWDTRILATDIDSEVIAFAQRGVYPVDRVGSIPDAELKSSFDRGSGAQAGFARVKPHLNSMITFRTLNLLGEWPMRGPFDIIFCRNVMIYFDQPTRERLLNRYAGLLAVGGYLCLGHSESIHSQKHPLRLVGKTIYRRVES
jgi:chemotaxis protein methyltransferase CheR